MANEFLEFALLYGEQGWAVFPLHGIRDDGRCTCGGAACDKAGKHPRTPNGFKDATTNEEIIQGWEGIWRSSNIGVATGVISGLVVLDVDHRHGGEESLQRLQADHSALPTTRTQRTGGGGQHFFFEHPGGAIRNSAGKLAEGLDIKADGGYVVAPPSLHASRSNYEWTETTRPVPMPTWLLQMVREPSGLVPYQGVVKGHGASYWGRVTAEGAEEGQRNAMTAALTGYLFYRGVASHAVMNLVVDWNRHRNRPPLEDGEVEETVRSIATTEISRNGF